MYIYIYYIYIYIWSGGRLCTPIGVPWRGVGFSTLSTGRFVLKRHICKGAESAEHAETAGYTYEGTQTTAVAWPLLLACNLYAYARLAEVVYIYIYMYIVIRIYTCVTCNIILLLHVICMRGLQGGERLTLGVFYHSV